MAGSANNILLNAVSATSAQNSSAINIQFGYGVSFFIVSSSASNSGTLQIQCSNDTSEYLGGQNAPAPINWINAPGTNSSVTVASGANGICYITPSNYPGFRWLRVVWTPSSGAGTITVFQFLTTF
jgi:hypothetical protein